jgi:hypothetical protein
VDQWNLPSGVPGTRTEARSCTAQTSLAAIANDSPVTFWSDVLLVTEKSDVSRAVSGRMKLMFATRSAFQIAGVMNSPVVRVPTGKATVPP